MEPVSELEVIANARRGDEQAFQALFETHRRWVYSLCLRMSRSSAEAEDLTQDAFLQLFRRISTFRGDSSFSTWFHRLVINTVLMHLRRRASEAARTAHRSRDPQYGGQPEYSAEDPSLRGIVDRVSLNQALNQLPESYRAVVILHDLEGYRHEELVRSKSGSVGTSKSQLHRARMMLRKLLSESRPPRLQAVAGASASRAR
jgi:RNA polymerase sigma-70 factor (ECF subfamily)